MDVGVLFARPKAAPGRTEPNFIVVGEAVEIPPDHIGKKDLLILGFPPEWTAEQILTFQSYAETQLAKIGLHDAAILLVPGDANNYTVLRPQ